MKNKMHRSSKILAYLTSVALPISVQLSNSDAALAINKIKPLEAAKQASQKVKNSLKKTEKKTEIREKWALIVALDNFHDKKIEPIKFAQNNALLMSALLANPELGKFGPKHVLTVTNVKAIQKNISKCLSEPWLLKHALPNDLVILYFCTRYIPTEDGQDLQLCMYEAETANPSIGTIKLKETLKEIRRRTQSPYVVSILDISPVGGPEDDETSSNGHQGESPDIDSPNSDLYQKIAEETGTTILAGNQIGQPSYHSSVDNSSFLVANLIEGLKAGSGQMDFETIVDYVKKNVNEQALSRKGKAQEPVFAVASNNQEITKVVPAMEVKSSKQESIRVGHSLSDYPDLAAREAERQRLAAEKLVSEKLSKPREHSIPIETASWEDDGGVDEDAAVGEVEFGPYMKRMKKAIQDKWTPPKGFKARSVVAVFSIMRNGQIVNPEIVDGSGVDSVDQSAMNALKTAKLEPLPKGSPPYVQIRYQFDWKVSQDSKSGN